MPWARLSGSPKIDVAIDMGNPLLNLTVDGFFKIGAVAATRVVAEDTYHIIQSRNISSHDFEKTLKKMCKEGAYWGTVAGVYVGTEYGVERIRGTRDWFFLLPGLAANMMALASNLNKVQAVVNKHHVWLRKNAMIGGAVTGALVSAVSSNKKDKIAIDAITGAAIATAAEFINYLT